MPAFLSRPVSVQRPRLRPACGCSPQKGRDFPKSRQSARSVARTNGLEGPDVGQVSGAVHIRAPCLDGKFCRHTWKPYRQAKKSAAPFRLRSPRVILDEDPHEKHDAEYDDRLQHQHGWNSSRLKRTGGSLRVEGERSVIRPLARSRAGEHSVKESGGAGAPGLRHLGATVGPFASIGSVLRHPAAYFCAAVSASWASASSSTARTPGRTTMRLSAWATSPASSWPLLL